MSMIRPRRVPFLGLIAGLGVAGLLAWPVPARGDDDLAREMSEVARQVKFLLDQKGQDAIAVGDFHGPARLASSSGPAIGKAIAEALQGMGVAVRRKAELEINGEYRDVEDRSSRRLAVQIKARVVDRSGAEVVALEPRGIFSVALFATLTGLTVELSPDATEERRKKELEDASDRPRAHLAGARVSASPGSPYAVEVLVRRGGDYAPRAAIKDGDGFAFVKIRRDEVYAVRLINDSPHEAVVTLSIDGLSVFAFSERRDYTHWLVASHGTLTVPGWHRTNQVSDSFVVTEYAKSAVAEALPSSSGVGTITATFAAAWPRGGDPPADEASAPKGTRSGDATGKGPPVSTEFVDVVREIGRVRSAVSVRYTKEDETKDLPPGRKP